MARKILVVAALSVLLLAVVAERLNTQQKREEEKKPVEEPKRRGLHDTASDLWWDTLNDMEGMMDDMFQHVNSLRRQGLFPRLALHDRLPGVESELDKEVGGKLSPTRHGWDVFAPRKWHPTADISETAGSFIVHSELPGVKPEDISLDLQDGNLVLKGSKTEEKEEDSKEKKYHWRERTFGSFQRSFRLPDGVKLEDVKATFSNGVLEVTIPKPPEVKKTTKIPITLITPSPNAVPPRP